MDFTVEKQTIQMKEEIKTELREHPLDCEAVIPDYCPDIERILKCTVTPSVANVRSSENTTIIEGTVQIALLYVDEKGELASFFQSIPLYHELSSVEGAEKVEAIARTQYCNCRAVNSRKVEFHGAVSIKVIFNACCSQGIVVGAHGNGVQLLTQGVKITTVATQTEKCFTVSDEIPIASGSVRRILQQKGTVQNLVTQSVGGKCIIKGDVSLFALYQNAEHRYETMCSEIPFSQILEADGLAESDTCDIKASLLNLELRPRTGLDGECKNIAVNADVRLELIGYRDLELSLVVDGYSTCCGMGIRRCTDDLLGVIHPFNEIYTEKKRLEIGRELTTVVDCRCEAEVNHIHIEQGQLTIGGTISCGVLGLEQNGTPCYLEKTFDFSWHKDLGQSNNEWVCQATALVEKCSFTLVGEQEIELRVPITIHGTIHEKLSISGVTDLVMDATVTPETVEVPFVLYYAKAGERVFDIARRYHTSCEEVCCANKITEGILSENKALIIPVL